MTAAEPSLARRLTTPDAALIGVGSMVGAGVFVVWGPAVAAAGSAAFVGLAIAAVVAVCNALASAQLAATYPTSGGAYVWGRERLGATPGFLAGWAFVTGKSASAAAMALTVAAYTVPYAVQRPVALAAVALLTLVNCLGITRTALVTRILVALVLAVLAVAVVAMFAGAHESAGAVPAAPLIPGILQSAGLLFFAFAGYARIATLAEEVVDPARTIPRAMLAALGAVLLVYAVVGVALFSVLSVPELAASRAPIADAVARSAPVLVLLVAAGAAVSALGALLALLAGIGRTGLAMARGGDLPHPLSAVHPRFRVPHRMELAAGAVVCALVLVGDVRTVIGFSSFGVLLYYGVANAAAFTQSREARRVPRALQVLGGVGCVVLAFALPWQSVAGGTAVIGIGVVARAVAHSRRRV